MARVDFDFRTSLKRSNCDVLTPKTVNLDFRDESPPNSNFDFTDLLRMSQHTQVGNTVNDNSAVETNVISQLTLSPLTNDKPDLNQPCAISSDVSLSDLVTVSDAQVFHSDQKTGVFTNSAFNSLCNSDSWSMKFKDDSACEVNTNLSDILSGISIEEYDPSLQKSLNRSISPVLNFNLSDISVPELWEIQKSNSNSSLAQCSSFENTHLSTESRFNVVDNLSDILSSINIDTNDQVQSHLSIKSSSLYSEKACLGDEKLCNRQLLDLNAASNECSDGISSLSSCDDNSTLSLAALAKSHFLSNGTNEILNIQESDSGNHTNKSAEKIEEVNFSFFDFPCHTISTHNEITRDGCKNGKDVNFSKSKLDLSKDLGFSFFPEPSLNDLNDNVDNRKSITNINQNNSNKDDSISMLDLLNSVNIPTCNKSVCKSNEDSINMLDLLNSVNSSPRSTSISESNAEDNVSMLDLFNSVNTPSRSTSVSESSGFFSDEIEKTDYSPPINANPDEDDNEILNIDLSMCIKSPDDDENLNIDLSMCIKSPDNNSSFNPTDILENNLNTAAATLEIPPTEPPKTFEQDVKYSLPLKTFIIPDGSRANIKQSLFAKAVACKPKKDPTLLQKVAKIKCELFNNIFDRPVLVKSQSTPQKTTAIYSNESPISCTGRRIFAPRPPCEFQ